MPVSCTACGATNDDGARFCVDCGTRISASVSCPSCGTEVSRGRFCPGCGTRLPSPPAPAVEAPNREREQAPPPVAERRLTSVLFGDLVGFTSISERRDPEEVREILSRYFVAARTVVQRYGGTVEKFIGDAVMAVWGVPTSHEDDAERAVRAGLDLVDRVNGLADEIGVEGLSMRVGVVTGEVAVTLGAEGEGMVAGDAVNTASRVQSVAMPGTVWVDDATHSLTAAAVAYADAGEHELKGKSSPIRLHEARTVVAAVGGAQRVDGLEAAFIGRDRELRLVKEMFEATVEDRRSRLLLVSGVAGMGKSRLGWEFEKYVDGLRSVVRWHRGRCLSYGDGVAFWALAEMLRGRLGQSETDPDEELVAKLDAGLDQWVPDDAERAWLRPRIAVLLGMESHTFPRDDVFAAWTVFLERVAAGAQALVLLVEDLQYADDGLLDFLDHALETSQFPLFVLGLARPELLERRPDAGTGRRKTTLHLEPLPDAPMEHLVDGLVDGLPEQTRTALVARADGIPLYAVETVRALIDRDAVIPRDGRYVMAADAADRVDLTTLGAPASLHALVSSRLDALEPGARSLVQDASVLGMSFTRAALAAVTHVDRNDIDGLLAPLVRKEIFELQKDLRSPERGQYRFVQAVVRQVAYETLSRRDRKGRHLSAAHYLAAEPDQAGDLSAVVAQHYLDAVASSAADDDDVPALVADAQLLLQRAAQRAMGIGSPAEALRHYQSALALPVTDDVRARLDEGAATAAMSMGDPATTTEHATRAIAIDDDAGRGIDAARTAAVMGRALMQHQDLSGAIALLTPRYEALKDDAAADEVLLALTETLGQSHNYLGDTSVARHYVERMLLIAEAQQDLPRIVIAMTHWASFWIEDGMPTAGRALLVRAVELARELHQPSALIRPLINTAAFHNAHDLAFALSAAQEAATLARQTGNRPMESLATANVLNDLWHLGRWQDLRAALAEPPSDEQDWSGLSQRFATAQWLAEATSGEVVPLPEQVATLVDAEDLQTRAWALAAVAAGLLRPEEQQRRAKLLAEAVRVCMRWSGTDDDFIGHWTPAVESANRAGDELLVDDLLGLVEGRAPGLVTRFAHAELFRLRALTCQRRGQTKEVEHDLRAAVEELTAFGAQFCAARAKFALGAHLHDDERDDEALPLIEDATAMFATLDAQPWMRRAQEASERLVTA